MDHTYARVHTLAILKGAVEGDDTRHLASLLAMGTHAAPLLRAGLIVPNDSTDEADPRYYVPTDAGQRFYTEHHLGDQPDGRATNWPDAPLLAADAALRALEGR